MPRKSLAAVVLACLLASAPAQAVPVEPRVASATPAGDDANLSQEAVERELDMFRKTGVSLHQALRIAERIHPGSTTADISFDAALGAPVYKVRTVSGGQIYECDVDGLTSQVKNEAPFASLQGLQESDRQNLAALRSARLKMSDAVAIAEKSAAGKAIAGGLASKDGRLNFIIIVLSDDGLKQVLLEPAGHGRR